MPVSKIVTLWLRGGGLKDDKGYIDNGQKDNDDKNNDDTNDGDNNNNQNPSQGVSFSSTVGCQNTSDRSHYHHHNYCNNFRSNSYN
eukprot:76883-Ditylum_brightwellii.AAC.1